MQVKLYNHIEGLNTVRDYNKQTPAEVVEFENMMETVSEISNYITDLGFYAAIVYNHNNEIVITYRKGSEKSEKRIAVGDLNDPWM